MTAHPSDVPAGFHEHASGLIVPDFLAREREVWTRADWKILERATKLVASRGLRMFLQCAETPACRETPLARHREPDGGISLRCAHRDRVVVNGL